MPPSRPIRFIPVPVSFHVLAPPSRSARSTIRATSTRDRRRAWRRCSDVGLDGLGAEEQLLGDLAVGLAVDDAAGDLELALGERVHPAPWRRRGWERRWM